VTSAAAGLAFDLSGFGLRFTGLPEVLAHTLRREWAAFETGHVADPLVEFRCEIGPHASDDAPFEPRAMEASFIGGGAAFEMKEGSVDVPAEGEAPLRVGPTEPEKQYLTVLNLACAAIAWRLPSRGGALLHAAGIVLEGRGFVLVGPEGSGKTTFSRLARDAGATILSDDVVVVRKTASGSYDVLGSPIRARDFGSNAPGHWPLAALLLPEWGAPAKLSLVPGLRTRARVLANLPFVTEAAATDDRAGRVAEDLASSAPSRILTFPPDPSFLPLLAGFSAQ